MDRPLCVHTKKKKATKSKKKPIKVVYISNPMKVNTTASEFRALVQQLTGQYAAVPDASQFPGGGIQKFPDRMEVSNDDLVLQVPTMGSVSCAGVTSSDTPFDPHDDFLMPDNYSGSFSFPSNLFECPHVDHLLTSLDAL